MPPIPPRPPCACHAAPGSSPGAVWNDNAPRAPSGYLRYEPAPTPPRTFRDALMEILVPLYVELLATVERYYALRAEQGAVWDRFKAGALRRVGDALRSAAEARMGVVMPGPAPAPAPAQTPIPACTLCGLPCGTGSLAVVLSFWRGPGVLAAPQVERICGGCLGAHPRVENALRVWQGAIVSRRGLLTPVPAHGCAGCACVLSYEEPAIHVWEPGMPAPDMVCRRCETATAASLVALHAALDAARRVEPPRGRWAAAPPGVPAGFAGGGRGDLPCTLCGSPFTHGALEIVVPAQRLQGPSDEERREIICPACIGGRAEKVLAAFQAWHHALGPTLVNTDHVEGCAKCGHGLAPGKTAAVMRFGPDSLIASTRVCHDCIDRTRPTLDALLAAIDGARVPELTPSPSGGPPRVARQPSVDRVAGEVDQYLRDLTRAPVPIAPAGTMIGAFLHTPKRGRCPRCAAEGVVLRTVVVPATPGAAPAVPSAHDVCDECLGIVMAALREELAPRAPGDEPPPA